MITLLGIDPGLVHNGCVGLVIFPSQKEWSVVHHLVTTPVKTDDKGDIVLDVEKAARDIAHWAKGYEADMTVIEAYKPRSAYDTDANMGRLVNEIRRNIKGSKTVVNTGAKQTVRPPLMRSLGMWNFPTPTHHQDLRAAARILLYGALKEETLNSVLYDLMIGVVDGTGWKQV